MNEINVFLLRWCVEVSQALKDIRNKNYKFRPKKFLFPTEVWAFVKDYAGITPCENIPWDCAFMTMENAVLKVLKCPKFKYKTGMRIENKRGVVMKAFWGMAKKSPRQKVIMLKQLKEIINPDFVFDKVNYAEGQEFSLDIPGYCKHGRRFFKIVERTDKMIVLKEQKYTVIDERGFRNYLITSGIIPESMTKIDYLIYLIKKTQAKIRFTGGMWRNFILRCPEFRENAKPIKITLSKKHWITNAVIEKKELTQININNNPLIFRMRYNMLYENSCEYDSIISLFTEIVPIFRRTINTYNQAGIITNQAFNGLEPPQDNLENFINSIANTFLSNIVSIGGDIEETVLYLLLTYSNHTRNNVVIELNKKAYKKLVTERLGEEAASRIMQSLKYARFTRL